MGLLDSAKDKARDMMDSGDKQQDDSPQMDDTMRQSDTSMMDETDEKKDMI